MADIVHRVPFLRIFIAFAIGISIGPFLQPDAVYLVVVLAGLSFILLLLNHFYGYSLSFIFGIVVHLALMFLGILVFTLSNKKPEFYTRGKFLAIVTEKMTEKPNSFQTVLEIHAFADDDSIYSTREKVVAIFEKNEQSRSLLPGQTVLFEVSPNPIRNNKNPFEFDYERYLARQKIYRQVYLPAGTWCISQLRLNHSFRITAEQIRLFFLNVYESKDFGYKELSVLSALTLGYKKGLEPEVKRVFASAGVMHVLAVSGLHTGIVFIVVSFLFGFLKKKQSGRYVFVLFVIAVLWGFAFITGLSPSVKRAATMFSFVIIGQNLRRQTNTYNMLAASAFFLLLLNPDNLYEAGFQLSYTAVFGILFLQPRLQNLFAVKNKFLNYFWLLFTVSIAAQIATFPITSYYFKQFPTYFWISNLLIIPAVTFLIPLGLLMLVFSWIPFLSSLLSYITGFILKHLILFLEFIESLPVAVVRFHFSVFEILLISVIMVFIFLYVEARQKWQLRVFLVFVLIFIGILSGGRIFHSIRKEIIVYNYSQQPVVHLVAGKNNYIVTEEKLLQDNMLQALIENTVIHLHLNSPVYLICHDEYEDSNLLLKDGFLFFHDRLLLLNSDDMEDSAPFRPYVLVSTGKSGKKEIGIKIGKMHRVIKEDHNVTLYFLSKNGAFREKLNL
jgi:competence protein ComEC